MQGKSETLTSVPWDDPTFETGLRNASPLRSATFWRPRVSHAASCTASRSSIKNLCRLHRQYQELIGLKNCRNQIGDGSPILQVGRADFRLRGACGQELRGPRPGDQDLDVITSTNIGDAHRFSTRSFIQSRGGRLRTNRCCISSSVDRVRAFGSNCRGKRPDGATERIGWHLFGKSQLNVESCPCHWFRSS